MAENPGVEGPFDFSDSDSSTDGRKLIREKYRDLMRIIKTRPENVPRSLFAFKETKSRASSGFRRSIVDRALQDDIPKNSKKVACSTPMVPKSTTAGVKAATFNDDMSSIRMSSDSDAVGKDVSFIPPKVLSVGDPRSSARNKSTRNNESSRSVGGRKMTKSKLKQKGQSIIINTSKTPEHRQVNTDDRPCEISESESLSSHSSAGEEIQVCGEEGEPLQSTKTQKNRQRPLSTASGTISGSTSPKRKREALEGIIAQIKTNKSVQTNDELPIVEIPAKSVHATRDRTRYLKAMARNLKTSVPVNSSIRTSPVSATSSVTNSSVSTSLSEILYDCNDQVFTADASQKQKNLPWRLRLSLGRHNVYDNFNGVASFKGSSSPTYTDLKGSTRKTFTNKKRVTKRSLKLSSKTSKSEETSEKENFAVSDNVQTPIQILSDLTLHAESPLNLIQTESATLDEPRQIRQSKSNFIKSPKDHSAHLQQLPRAERSNKSSPKLFVDDSEDEGEARLNHFDEISLSHDPDKNRSKSRQVDCGSGLCTPPNQKTYRGNKNNSQLVHGSVNIGSKNNSQLVHKSVNIASNKTNANEDELENLSSTRKVRKLKSSERLNAMIDHQTSSRTKENSSLTNCVVFLENLKMDVGKKNKTNINEENASRRKRSKTIIDNHETVNNNEEESNNYDRNLMDEPTDKNEHHDVINSGEDNASRTLKRGRPKKKPINKKDKENGKRKAADKGHNHHQASEINQDDSSAVPQEDNFTVRRSSRERKQRVITPVGYFIATTERKLRQYNVLATIEKDIPTSKGKKSNKKTSILKKNRRALSPIMEDPNAPPRVLSTQNQVEQNDVIVENCDSTSLRPLEVESSSRRVVSKKDAKSRRNTQKKSTTDVSAARNLFSVDAAGPESNTAVFVDRENHDMCTSSTDSPRRPVNIYDRSADHETLDRCSSSSDNESAILNLCIDKKQYSINWVGDNSKMNDLINSRDSISMEITANNPLDGGCTGFLKVDPNIEKPIAESENHSLYFLVISGTAYVQVEVGNEVSRCTVHKQYSFIIPKGSKYFIRNVRKTTPLLLYFVRVRPEVVI